MQLPFSFAKRHGVLIKDSDSSQTTIAYRPGITTAVLSELRRFLSMPMQLEAVTTGQFDDLLSKTYEQQSSQAMQMMEDLGDDLDLEHVAQQLSEPEDLLESQDDAPIIRLINALLTEAAKENASDIHIEPYENRLSVRFRVDGVLKDIIQPDRKLAPLLVSRIKVMAKLDIAEKRLPQDGRISLKVAGRPVDVRVSTIPSGHGERVVLRLLDKQAGRLNLEHLGMAKAGMEQMNSLISKPHGIILVTGPTGSGKTTTLYAVLSKLNSRERNI
ncbi:MAG: ATPase, T2SS/T4P/T4SS family, partial [Gammaproteobacteria bacterium]|nr:ATPase, T2SS/T4P/T4SS family [Gammaproteobacteria bacterium]